MREVRIIGALTLGVLLAAGAVATVSLQELAGHGAGARPGERLGVTFAESPDRHALMVNSLRIGGAAQRAGMHVGDLVERVAGQPVFSPADIERDAAGHDPVDFHVRRGEDSLELLVAAKH